jgi:hypothetical protein
MGSSTEERDRRRRRPFVLLLVLGLGVGLGLGLEELLEGDGGGARPLAAAPVRSPAPADVQVVTPVPQQANQAGHVVGASRGTTAGSLAGRTATLPDLLLQGAVDGEVGPGAPATLLVTVRNPSAQRLRVIGLAGRVASVSRVAVGGCSAGWYHVGAYAGDLLLGAGAQATVRLPVTFDDLPDVDQNGCRGARYAFSYTVRAVAA